MTHNERESHIKNLVRQGRWDEAIDHARIMPMGFDIWQQFPSMLEDGMPNEAIHKTLDNMSSEDLKNSGFLFEMSHNLMGHHDADTLRRLANLASTYHEVSRFVGHPNYRQSDEEERLSRVHDFWRSYERKVEPEHFALVKSLFSGKPEEIKHRDKAGDSSNFYISENRIYKLGPGSPVHQFKEPQKYGGVLHTKADHVLPHMRDYSLAVQNKIMNDDGIYKRYFNNEPYIKVHRGVGGHYSKQIRDAVQYDPKTTAYDHKSISIPSAPFSSWTTNFFEAKSFAKGRGGQLDLPGHGLVLTKWMPVKNIMHSGYHQAIPGRFGIHPSEEEIVFGHPTGRLKINSSELHFENLIGEDVGSEGDIPGSYGSTFDKGIKRQKLAKNIRDTALSLGMAAAMLGIPSHLQEVPHPENSAQAQEKPKSVPHRGLKIIGILESSGGINTKHSPAKSDLHQGNAAIGRYGMMPVTIKEAINKDRELSVKYPELASYEYPNDSSKIRDAMTSNEDLETDVANSHWKKLGDRFDWDENRMAHAWFNGVAGTIKKHPEEIADHFYVKRYNRYKKLMQLEEKEAEGLKKSESGIPESASGIVKFNVFDKTHPADQESENQINAAIKSRAIHPVPYAGKFTENSFVVGGNNDNAWLIKLQSHVRPGIASATTGLQPIKESAFYDVGANVFGLWSMIPDVLLGEVAYSDTKVPASAIKFFSDRFKLAVEFEKEHPGSLFTVLEKYRKAGLLHEAAAMLYILGDGDSHGKNVMTDGYTIRLIDHGSGFAGNEFDPAKDPNIFIPYIMRFGRINDLMTQNEKLEKLPKIDSLHVKNMLKVWILSINSHNLEHKLNNKGIDPEPTLKRLKKLQDMVSSGISPDEAVNMVWVGR